MTFNSDSPVLSQFLEDPSQYKGENLTGSEATARTFQNKRTDLAQNLVGALKKRYTDNSEIVKACQIASFPSWPIYSSDNQTAMQGNGKVVKSYVDVIVKVQMYVSCFHVS